MLLTQRDDRSSGRASGAHEQLFVAWQDPDTRAIRPVGVLSAHTRSGAVEYEFRYLQDAQRPPFRPFVEFPDLNRVYRSSELFATFENRVMPRGRPDFGSYVESLGLPLDAAPFELLAASFGIRATDTVEVFRPPVVDPATGLAECRFLARGIRHIDGAADAIATLSRGDRLTLVHDLENPVDPRALRLESMRGEAVGFAPAYLLGFLHRSAEVAGGLDRVSVVVDACDPQGPFHLRLLCLLRAPVPAEGFEDPAFEPIVSWNIG